MEALLELPENWHVVITEENKDLLSDWLFRNKIEKGIIKYPKVVVSSIAGECQGYSDNFGQEISTADFKRLVLGEKNYEDYGVVGCYELKKHILKYLNQTLMLY